ncbi:MAG: hypothetical protein A3D93_06885 [Acidobacteria bacterium RIFCSPHIGHO2_12_FULL_67_30]|nr:MAG: hypothetical protein A3B65_05180 [Acidobacteria bacterium RIFCSPHIGHO2_02_FULL_67_57]OFV85145.1 MAG: hypothetical protein A2620_02195 [Acidobacteria bacterium RIFCSPHIGHO2_01_FULL_67_28]OFV88649.1 MAG: hypothetical protein A3D93_06885 [Acidobacteria bacterium RIFCSPHIGHO2_12_FULL_67_30]
MGRPETIFLKKTWRALGVLLLAVVSAAAQGQRASPVRYTEAREQSVRRTIVLPGSVESRVESVVAAEVSALVVELVAREGDTVEKGAPLVRLRTTTFEIRLQAAEAQHKEAEARMKLAERNLERARELFASKVISQQQLDDATYEFTAWQGRVEQLQASITGIKLDIARCTIRAPFAGVVTRERTEVGEWLGEGDPVMEMVSLDELEVRIEVPERYFRLLHVGGRATVSFESLPGLEVAGSISALIPRADPQARTFPVKVRVPNREGRIGVGMLAQVTFAGGESYRATLVPKDAVILRGPQQFVYLLNGDNTVSMVTVETGTGVGAWIAVEGGIKPGQKVVTRGNERLQPGQLVQGQPLDYPLP